MEMFDKLEDIVNRYEDITAELSNPDVVNDQDRFRKLMKEQNNILPIVTAFTEYKDCKKNIEDSLAMLSEESDEELLELAKEELNESKKRVEELENELKILLLPKDPNEDKDILVEIRAETKQHCLQLNFSECIHTMLSREAGKLKWSMLMKQELAA